jgi:lipoprotein signal peptidase
MVSKKIHIVGLLACGFFIIFFDQCAKYIALHHTTSDFIIKPWLGWELFFNPGVAFGLPVANWLAVWCTPLILLCMLYWFQKRWHEPKTPISFFYGLTFLIAGALSNYFDRVFYAATIDYFRIFYSVINAADISIVLGAITLIYTDNLKG